MTNAFESFLTQAGKDVEKVFTDIFTPQNVAAGEVLVGTLFPGASTLFNLIANTAVLVEQKFAGIGQQSGTGAHKLAQVIATIGSTITAFATTNNVVINTTQVVNAVVGFLNAIGSTPVATPAPAAA